MSCFILLLPTDVGGRQSGQARGGGGECSSAPTACGPLCEPAGSVWVFVCVHMCTRLCMHVCVCVSRVERMGEGRRGSLPRSG